MGDHDFFTGPIYMAEASALEQSDLRQAGYIWNEEYRDIPTQDEVFTANRALVVAGFTMLGQHLLYRPVPLTCNRLAVRVQVQAFRGAGDDDDIVIRCYTMNRPPVAPVNQVGPPAWQRFFASVTVNANDGSGNTGGDWYDFPLVKIMRTENSEGTWLALAFDVQDAGGAGSTADQDWRVRAWTGEPGLRLVDGGLPLG